MGTTTKSETFLQDNLVVMARYPDKYFDLAIADPPYGRKEHGGKNRTGFAIQKNGARSLVKCGNYSGSLFLTLKYWIPIGAAALSRSPAMTLVSITMAATMMRADSRWPTTV